MLVLSGNVETWQLQLEKFWKSRSSNVFCSNAAKENKEIFLKINLGKILAKSPVLLDTRTEWSYEVGISNRNIGIVFPIRRSEKGERKNIGATSVARRLEPRSVPLTLFSNIISRLKLSWCADYVSCPKFCLKCKQNS